MTASGKPKVSKLVVRTEGQVTRALASMTSEKVQAGCWLSPAVEADASGTQVHQWLGMQAALGHQVQSGPTALCLSSATTPSATMAATASAPAAPVKDFAARHPRLVPSCRRMHKLWRGRIWRYHASTEDRLT